MRIHLGVAVSMVHTVHHSIGTRIQIGRTLRKPGEQKEEFFPERSHCEHLMRSITVQKEGLGKQGKVPVDDQKQYNRH